MKVTAGSGSVVGVATLLLVGSCLVNVVSLLPSSCDAFQVHLNAVKVKASNTNALVPVAETTKLSLPPSAAAASKPPSSISSSSVLFAKSENYDDDEDYEDDEDDNEDYDPLADGVDSVSWLPSLNIGLNDNLSSISSTTASSTMDSSSSSTAEVLPFFPLGGIVYTPNSEHVLNIFEPRYRQMYNDILMNGSKRFVVSMSHPNKDATFATTGVIFHLEDLKEVSELTDDRVKYICNHKVTNRVNLKRVLNPEVWRTRDTYLKVEAEIIYEDEFGNETTLKKDGESNSDATEKEDDEDEDDDEEDDAFKKEIDEKKDAYQQLIDAIKPKKQSSSTSSSTINKRKRSPEEMILIASFQNLVQKQHEAEEDVRFTRSSINSLAVAPGGGEDGLWQTIRLWQSFIDQRLVARQNEMQREFQEKLLEFLKKEKGIDEKELPSAIGFNDLSPALQQEVQELQKRMGVELQPLVLESTLTMQKILECKNHKARCLLLKHFMDVEKKRLDAKCTLQGMFAGDASAVTDKESDGVKAKATSGNVDSSGEEDEEDEEDEENEGVVDEKDVESLKSSLSSSSDSSKSTSQGALFVDEPDAFQ